MVRTALYRRNEVGIQAPYEPCVRCGKPVLPQGAVRLELLVGGEILPVGDPRSGSATSQGSFPIGPDCARALGSKYILPPEETRPLLSCECVICASHAGEREALQARVTALEAAVRKYGRHDALCSVVGGYSYPCTCGLDKAIPGGTAGCGEPSRSPVSSRPVAAERRPARRDWNSPLPYRLAGRAGRSRAGRGPGGARRS